MFLERIIWLGTSIYGSFLKIWEWLFTEITFSDSFDFSLLDNLSSHFLGFYESGSLWFASTFGYAQTTYTADGMTITFAPIDIILGFIPVILIIKLVSFLVSKLFGSIPVL